MLRGSEGRGHSPHLIDIKITKKWLFFRWNSIFRITGGKLECSVEKNISQEKQEPATNMARPPGRETSTLVTAPPFLPQPFKNNPLLPFGFVKMKEG